MARETPVVATPSLALEPVVAEAPREQFSHEASYSPFDPVAAEASFSNAGPIEPVLTDFEFTLADEPVAAVESDGPTVAPFESSFDLQIVDEAPERAPAQEPVLMFDASRPSFAEAALVDAPALVEEIAPAPTTPADVAPAAPDWSP